MIKQRRQNSKTKVIVSLSLVCLMFVAVITAAILINAFPNQTLNGGVKVSYYAKDVSAEVRAWYQEKEGFKTYLTTTKGGYDTTLVIDANDKGTTSKELFMDKDIVLTGTNNYVIFCYEFTNTGSKTFAGEHDFTNAVSGVNPSNMSISYSLDGITYDSVNTGFSISYNSTQKYYFKIEVKDLAFDADLNGAISWDLNSLVNATTGKDGGSDPARIGAMSYTTFEEAYTASSNGDVIVLRDDLTLPGSYSIAKNVKIVAEQKNGNVDAQQVQSQSNNNVTITIEDSLLIYGNVELSANSGYPIVLTTNNASLDTLVAVAAGVTLTTTGVNFVPADGITSQKAIAVYGTFYMQGGNISGFKHADGGAMYITAEAVVKITGNSNITNCSSSSYGGAICNLGTLHFGRSSSAWTGKLYNNTADLGGGAICNIGSVWINSGTIEGNYCLDFANSVGGAILNSSSASVLVMEGGEIINNGFKDSETMTFGGAIYNAGTVKIYSGKISGNKAANGGAVFNAASLGIGSSSATGTISTAVISNNHASLAGGAIYNTETGTIVQRGATFDSNRCENGSASGVGGAIANMGNAIIYDGIYKNNYAGLGGGVVYSVSGNFEISGGTFTNNSSNNFGGVIYNSSSTFKLLSGVYSQNTAAAGGVVYNDGNVNGRNVSADGVSRCNATMSHNSATNGGAIFSTGALDIWGINYIGNVAEIAGGALYNSGTGDECFATFDGNYCTDSLYSMGGAIYNDGSYKSTMGGNKYINNGFIDENYTSLGGAIYNSGDLLFPLDMDFINNAAKEGGVIYNSGSVIINGGKFTQNYAVSKGGAIYNSAICELHVLTKLNNNGYRNGALTRDGGAIYTTGSVDCKMVTQFEINNNKAQYGGAIYLYGESAKFYNIDVVARFNFINNYAEVDGGAIYLDSVKNASFTAMNFYGNYAGESGGSIMLNKGSSATIFDCNFGNKDDSTTYYNGVNAKYGGAIFVSAKTDSYNYSSVTIDRGDFKYLSASVAGGAITNLGVCTLGDGNLSGCSFSYCSAQIGGAIANVVGSLTHEAVLTIGPNVVINNCSAAVGEGNGIVNLGKIRLTNVLHAIKDDIALVRGMTKIGGIKLVQGTISFNYSGLISELKISFIDATINDITDFESIEVNINGTKSRENTTIPDNVDWREYQG